jgi:long-chain acyl-CoA synthetase
MNLVDQLRFSPIIFRNQLYSPADVSAGVNDLVKYIDSNVSHDAPFIHLHFRNHIKCLLAYLAIIKSGHVCVIIDPRIGPLEYEELLEDSTPGAIIKIDPKTIPFDFANEIQMRPNARPWSEELSDVCTLAYTAADDGFMKGAMLTHGNMVSNARAIAHGNSVDAGSISCAFISMDHLFALQTGFLAPMIEGGKLLLAETGGQLHVAKWLNDLHLYSVSHAYSVPVIYYLMSKEPDCAEKTKTLRSVISGGCRLFERAAQGFSKATHHQIREGYGLTEASPVCTWNFPDQPVQANSVGRPIDCCSISIQNANGNHLPPGTQGEICIRGSNVMKGYFQNANSTSTTLKNEWLRSKDFGYADSDGYLFFAQTKKAMINFSGEKIYPAYYERVINKNPHVDSVKVASLPNPIFGQVPQVQVTLKKDNADTRKEFETWCSEGLSQNKLAGRFKYLSGSESK